MIYTITCCLLVYQQIIQIIMKKVINYKVFNISYSCIRRYILHLKCYIFHHFIFHCAITYIEASLYDYLNISKYKIVFNISKHVYQLKQCDITYKKVKIAMTIRKKSIKLIYLKQWQLKDEIEAYVYFYSLTFFTMNKGYHIFYFH